MSDRWTLEKITDAAQAYADRYGVPVVVVDIGSQEIGSQFLIRDPDYNGEGEVVARINPSQPETDISY